MASESVAQDLDGIQDPDDYKQRQRIKSILEAREQVLDERQKALDLRARGQIGEKLAAKIVREAVERYILESEQTIRRYFPEDGTPREAWDSEQQLAVDVGEERELGRLEMKTQEIVFEGVFDIVNAPEEFTDNWPDYEQSHVSGVEEVIRSETYQVPLTVSKSAYRQLNRFWNEMGMDLDMDHKLPTDKL